VTIPLSRLVRGRAGFFCYRDHTGARIRFILARDEHDGVHLALDACEQCGRYHLGYKAGDDEILCRYCGNRYRLNEMEKGKASCIPVKLPYAQRGDNVEIKVLDIEKRQAQF
jgi:uncharacterized membrane protein